MSKLEIEIGDTVESRADNKGARGVCIDAFFGYGSYKISWYDYDASWYNLHDLKLIKKGKTMQFTKSDLKTGVHFVKDREGVFYAVCRNTFCGLNRFVRLSSFNDELVNVNGNSELDIMEVYETDEDKSMSSYLQGLGLKRVWKRTEQTPAQKEMEVLQAKMEKATGLVAEVQEQITKLQGKL